jgi:hypothetical protein
MRTQEIPLSGELEEQFVLATLESACSETGLTLALKSRLQSYPGSTHLHYKRACAHGVLEITYWPQKKRAWFSVHENRESYWIDELLPKLASRIQAGLEIAEGLENEN